MHLCGRIFRIRTRQFQKSRFLAIFRPSEAAFWPKARQPVVLTSPDNFRKIRAVWGAQHCYLWFLYLHGGISRILTRQFRKSLFLAIFGPTEVAFWPKSRQPAVLTSPDNFRKITAASGAQHWYLWFLHLHGGISCIGTRKFRNFFFLSVLYTLIFINIILINTDLIM